MILGSSVATWTQEDIDALKEALKGGVLSVHYAGPPQRSITYQSLSEMRKLLAEMVAQVSEPAPYRRVQWNKGFRNG